MGAKTPNLTTGDVLIEGGVIAEVGPRLRARDAERVDASDAIVMPGFVDTHRHAWTSLFRNVGDIAPGGGSSASETVPGGRYAPDDVYAATLIGLLGAAESGITTVVDWADLALDLERADAALRAHADSGLRTVFAFVPERPPRSADAEGATRAMLAHLAEAAGPTTVIALGSSDLGDPNGGPSPTTWGLARELGLRIHAHAAPGSGRGAVARLAQRGLLDEHVTLVHCSELDDADADAIRSSGAAISLTPSSQMAGGLGRPQIQRLIDRDIRPGLGVDHERMSPGDLFAQMRATISWQHATVFDRKLAGKAGLPRLMSTRDVIRFATVDGARVVGDPKAGSLEPGKPADVVVLRTDRPNIAPVNDPIGAVVWGMDTSNVDRVFVGGRALMTNGVLEADVRRARELATAARDRVVAAAGPVAGAASGIRG